MHLTLEASSYQKEPTRVTAEVTVYDRAESWRRAAGVGGPLLLGGLLSAFIPGWHFVGVPGFLIASFVFGRQRLRQARSFGPTSGPCPACGSDQAFDVPDAAVLPVTVRCPGCGEFLKLCEATARHDAPASDLAEP